MQPFFVSAPVNLTAWPAGMWLAYFSLKLIIAGEIMPNRLILLASLALGIGFMTGCAFKAPPDDIISPERAMAFGYIESDAKHPIDSVDFHEYGVTYIQPFKNPPRVLVFKDGYFMAENLKPGKYYIAGFFSGTKKYALINGSQSAFQLVINIKPGAVQYIGSYKLTVHKEHQILSRGEFDITETLRPGERMALRKFYNVTAGTGWQKKIVRRMQALRQ